MTSLRVRMSLYGERALWDRPWWSRTSEADVYLRVDGHTVRVVAPAEMIARLDWYKDLRARDPHAAHRRRTIANDEIREEGEEYP